MSKRNEFVKEHLDDLIRNDEVVSHYFQDENGRLLEKDSPLFRERAGLLEESLEKSYDIDLKKHDHRTIAQTFVARPLRYLAAGLYVFGTAAFIGLPGPAGFGLAGAGAGASSIADAIDSHAYVSHDQLSKGQIAASAGEGVAEKVLGYFPIGTGLLDVYRGNRKFENKVNANREPKLEYALTYAKTNFIRKLKLEDDDNGRRIIPISEFRDDRYSNEELRKAA